MCSFIGTLKQGKTNLGGDESQRSVFKIHTSAMETWGGGYFRNFRVGMCR